MGAEVPSPNRPTRRHVRHRASAVHRQIGTVLSDSPLPCIAMGRLPPGWRPVDTQLLDGVFRCLGPPRHLFFARRQSSRRSMVLGGTRIQLIADRTTPRFSSRSRNRPIPSPLRAASTTHFAPSDPSASIRVCARNRRQIAFRTTASGAPMTCFAGANVCVLPC